eukprot:scaffold14916_cov128-Isochrysis_galbana.AAC.1
MHPQYAPDVPAARRATRGRGASHGLVYCIYWSQSTVAQTVQSHTVAEQDRDPRSALRINYIMRAAIYVPYIIDSLCISPIIALRYSSTLLITTSCIRMVRFCDFAVRAGFPAPVVPAIPARPEVSVNFPSARAFLSR